MVIANSLRAAQYLFLRDQNKCRSDLHFLVRLNLYQQSKLQCLKILITSMYDVYKLERFGQ